MDWISEQARWFWPDWFSTTWAYFSMVIGTSFVAIAAMSAIEHYWLGHPLIDGKTNRPMTRGVVILWLTMFGGIGAIVAVLGFLAHRSGVG